MLEFQFIIWVDTLKGDCVYGFATYFDAQNSENTWSSSLYELVIMVPLSVIVMKLKWRVVVH